MRTGIIEAERQEMTGGLDALASSIRERITGSITSMIFVGRELAEAERLIQEMKRLGKRPIPFPRWVTEIVGISMATAKNYRELFHKYEDEERIAKLPPSVALELCNGRVTKDAVDRVITEVETGRNVTKKEVRMLIRECNGTAKEQAQKQISIDDLLTDLNRVFDRHRRTIEIAYSTGDNENLSKLQARLYSYANSIGSMV